MVCEMCLCVCVWVCAMCKRLCVACGSEECGGLCVNVPAFVEILCAGCVCLCASLVHVPLYPVCVLVIENLEIVCLVCCVCSVYFV